MSLIYIKEF